MTATVNGLPVLRCTLHVPRIGAWHAQVSVEAEEVGDLDAFIELELPGSTWQGYARRVGAHHGRVEVLVVGGAGGLVAELEPRYYADAPVSVPLGDIMRESGEQLSLTVDPSVQSPMLARWTRSRGRAGRALADLVQTLGVESWRVLEDGTIWLGTEAWDEVSLEHDVLDEDPAHGRAALGVDEFVLRPGTVLEGRGISYVLHHLEPERMRSTVWYEPPGDGPVEASGTSVAGTGGGGDVIEGPSE